MSRKVNDLLKITWLINGRERAQRRALSLMAQPSFHCATRLLKMNGELLADDSIYSLSAYSWGFEVDRVI